MSSNFQFLKKIDNNLYDIISDAEKLYKDEYFEQCMTQTRKFGEQMCKNMMEQNNQQTGSFDEMLARLKDKSQGSAQEKEFIDDLYFLKQTGNKAVHGGKIKQEAMTALECLKRSFEAALTYCVYNQGAPVNILKLNYDIELLITDKKSKKSLKEKYEEAKQYAEQTQKNKQITKTIKKEPDRQKEIIKRQQTNLKFPIPIFWKMIIFLTCISAATTIFIIVAALISSIKH